MIDFTLLILYHTVHCYAVQSALFLSQLSSNNMVPLIGASKDRLDEDLLMPSTNANARAKMMINKCLNRITT